MCRTWYHRECLFMTPEEYEKLNSSNTHWYCATCLSIKANKIKWGNHEGEVAIKDVIQATYNEIVTWRKNLFMVPRGKAGSDFIKEIARIIREFTTPTKWTRLALAKVHIFIPLMLQKPSPKSKAKDHAKYLDKRLKQWSAGDLTSIMAENREIQSKLKKSHEKKTESKEKNFCKLMLLGKVSQAMKFINNDDSTRGVHSLSDEIKQLLEEKHPKAKDAEPDILITRSADPPQPVIYEGIDGHSIYKAAKHIQGSGGPTLIDADGWKHILCSRSFGNTSQDLCDAIAELAKKLCRDNIHPDTLHEFVANRLIPLDKGEDREGNPGVRPIGIGEILRRIIGKVIVENIRENIIEAAGPLQTCAGLRSGIEASIHAMRKVFSEDETEALLLVDAENAFNNLNRKAALHNIRELCPPFYQYLHNTYQMPAKMFINDQVKTDNIWSDEGSTQGDVTAMAMYAVGIRPLINILQERTESTTCHQVWYADDSSAAGKLREIRKWWDVLNEFGPKYGYFPKPSKTILILKDPQYLTLANDLFAGTGIKFSTSGERHLGAVIGSERYREEYVTTKVKNWIQDVEQLTILANEEPQLAYSAYTKAMCMRWCFLQRTVPNIKHHFIPLEETIRDKFIPAIIGRSVTDVERTIFSLPVRFGGLGIQNPVLTADIEFRNSSIVTKNLTNLIMKQESNLENYDIDQVKSVIAKLKTEKEEAFIESLEEVKNLVSERLRRAIEYAGEKGAGVWLTSLPLLSTQNVLNKDEFRNGIRLRYDWEIPGTARFCACGVKNTIEHILNCKLGGYVSMRHNNIRDLTASLLREVCRDVKIEPELLPIENSGNTSKEPEKARADVSAIGVWSSMERTFLDVRVTHPHSPSFAGLTSEQLYKKHEQEKKRKYNDRVLNVDRGTFTPLVLTTTGGMGPECTKFFKRVAELIATKRGEEYPDVVNYVRTKVRVALLKSVLIAIRGERGKSRSRENVPISDLSLNMVPERQTYEV